MADLPNSVVRQILESDLPPSSFEAFCAWHYSDVDDLNYVPTAHNYDLGRDARTEYDELVGGAFILASLQQTDLVGKAMRDLRKLLKTAPKARRVRFCFIVDVTDTLGKEIKKEARKIHEECLYEVTGMTQLLASIGRWPRAFEEHFELELTQLARLLRRAPDTAKHQAIGFRIALSAQVDGTGVDLRSSVLRQLTLRCLADGATITVQDLCRRISALLGLDGPVNEGYLYNTLQTQAAEGVIEWENETVRKRRSADDVVGQADATAGKVAIDGISAIRSAINKHSTRQIQQRTFNRVWEVVKVRIVDAFSAQGLEVARSLQSLADGNTSDASTPASALLLENLRTIADAIRDINPDDEQLQAVADIFVNAMLDPASKAKSWLASLALVYVAACSLSLHPAALVAVEARIKAWRLLPDTHVVLSLLGRGESDHEAVQRFCAAWRKNGGTLAVCEPVLEEVCRHARRGLEIAKRWGSSFDRLQLRALRLGGTLEAPKSNVFLRDAAVVNGNELKPALLVAHLEMFVQDTDQEPFRLQRILEGDKRFEADTTPVTDPTMVPAFYAGLLERRRNHADDEGDVEARCRTDASMLALLSGFRQADHKTGVTSILLTNSGHMLSVCKAFPASFKASVPIINLGRLAFALSLNPGVALSTRAISQMLFGDVFHSAIKGAEVKAAKVLSNFYGEAKQHFVSTSSDKFDASVWGFDS